MIKKPPLPPARVSLAFMAIGFLSFGISLAWVLFNPGTLLGDPYESQVLALAHLFLLGFMGSLVFGAGYMILPVISATSLASRPLAWVHWILHIGGLTGMVWAFRTMDFSAVLPAGGLMFLGMVLFISNLVWTSSKTNRSDPANLTSISALFWLLVASGLAIAILINKFHPVFPDFEPEWLMGMHAHLGLIGFFWMILLGTALKLFPIFLVSSRKAGAFSWIGLVFLNTSLFLLIPIEMLYPGSGRTVFAWMLFLGSLGYTIDLVRLLWGTYRPLDGGMATAALGVLTGLGILLWNALGQPFAPSGVLERELVRISFVVATWGVFTLAIFGMATRILPFLIWQVRYARKAIQGKVPLAQDLANRYALWALFWALLIGLGYLIAAQIADSPGGLQIAAICFAVGALWFVFIVSPALKTLLLGHQEAKTKKN